MDLRVARTRQSIFDAFLTLRAEHPIERITIRELANRAMINKATFYRHFHDIYDLSDQIENDLIEACLDAVEDPAGIFTREGFIALADVFRARKKQLRIVFSGGRYDIAIHKIHRFFLRRLQEHHPEIIEDREKRLLLTAMLYGGFHTFFVHRDEPYEFLITSLSKMTDLFSAR